MTNPAELYANEKVEWGTPAWIIECAGKLMKAIDLDPASSAEFNKRVGAFRFFTEADDGLKQSWHCGGNGKGQTQWGSSVLLNPPGRLVKEFWEKLVKEYDQGSVAEALWVGFNLDHLRYLGDFSRWPLEFPTLIPRKRIRFTHEDGTVSTKPSAANYITYLPIQGSRAFGRAAFREVFGAHGRIV